MRILITGGFGFLGTVLIHKLMREGHNITVIDDLSSGRAIKSDKISFYKISAEDPSCSLIFAGGDFDAVIHLAFKGFAGESYGETTENIFSNNVGLNNILNMSVKYKVKKFVLVSSFKVYGSKGPAPYTENDRLLPSDDEGQSYLSRENIAKEYMHRGLNVSIIRAGAVYGKDQYGSDLSFINSQTKSLGDLIHIDDFSRAVIKILAGTKDEVLNLSTGEGTGNIMDSFRIRTSLGFFPQTNWDEGANLAQNRLADPNSLGNDAPQSSNKSPAKRRWKEVVFLFIITAILSYILEFKLGIEADIFMIFNVFVAITYGLSLGVTSIFLTAAAYLVFEIYLKSRTVQMLVADTGSILHLTLYFVVGISVGLAIDERKKREASLSDQVDELEEKLLFTNTLYKKSLEVKDNLQSIIENYDNNLSNVNAIIERFIALSPEKIEGEIPLIFKDYFKSNDVSFYTFDGKEKLVLKSGTGSRIFEDVVYTNQYEFLKDSSGKKDIFVNKNLHKKIPRISIPIYENDNLYGYIFLGNVNFKYLNQLYINKLSLTANLISNLMRATDRLEVG